MQTRLEFDIDSNGEVSEDEAKVIVYCLHFAEEMFLFVDVFSNVDGSKSVLQATLRDCDLWSQSE